MQVEYTLYLDSNTVIYLDFFEIHFTSCSTEVFFQINKTKNPYLRDAGFKANNIIRTYYLQHLSVLSMHVVQFPSTLFCIAVTNTPNTSSGGQSLDRCGVTGWYDLVTLVPLCKVRGVLNFPLDLLFTPAIRQKRKRWLVTSIDHGESWTLTDLCCSCTTLQNC